VDAKSVARSRRIDTAEAELLEALAEDEALIGRPHTPREREAFAIGFFAGEYCEEIKRLMALGVLDEDDDP
jgi:hypothetical protein